jgi:hypothetical protein
LLLLAMDLPGGAREDGPIGPAGQRSALGVAIVSAALVAVHGATYHWTEVAMFIAVSFALTACPRSRVRAR